MDKDKVFFFLPDLIHSTKTNLQSMHIKATKLTDFKLSYIFAKMKSLSSK